VLASPSNCGYVYFSFSSVSVWFTHFAAITVFLVVWAFYDCIMCLAFTDNFICPKSALILIHPLLLPVN
jgi:hypothetical protein